MKIINLTITFFIEIAMLVAIGFYGMSRAWGLFPRLLLAISMVGIAIYLWWLFAAPKSEKRLRMPYLVFFRASMFLLGAVLLFLSGQKNYAIILAVLAIVTQTIAYFTE